MSNTSYTVAILMGGASAEAQVSRNSARQVGTALASKGHNAQAIELDTACVQRLIDLQPDAVFPALHGPPGEDGTVQGLLTMLGLPYVGSDVHGSALAMDKAVAKHIFRHNDLPVTDDLQVAADGADIDESVRKIAARLGSSIVIKPLNQGSAIGVTPLPDGGDITAALSTALKYGDCLVEPFVPGKEITVGILEVEDRVLAHPVIEIITSADSWYDYENRYTPGQSEHLIPAPLPERLSEELQHIAVSAHRVLGLADLSRADFLVTDSGGISLLEVNTLPGMTPTSLYPEGAAAMGYEFADLMDHLVKRAVARGPRQKLPGANRTSGYRS